MATGQISPYPKLQFFDNDGDPAAGYQLFWYEAGTTTKLDTFSDDALTVPNTNPIILDSAGRCTAFLQDSAYKAVLTTPTDTDPPTSPLWTVDGIRATPVASANIDISGTAGEALAQYDLAYLSDGSGSLTAGRWYKASSDHNYASVDAMSIGFVQVAATGAGDAVSVRTSGKSTVSGTLSSGTVYYVGATAGTISSSSTQTNRAPIGQADSISTIIFPIGGTISISIKAALATFAYGGSGSAQPGGGNDAGGGDTELTGYPISVPDNYLDSPGATIVLEGTLYLVANANSKSMKISIGTTGVLTVFTNADNVVDHKVPFRINLIRRSATKASVQGTFFYGATDQAQANVWVAAKQLSGTVDWTTQQDLKIYLVGTLAGDIFMTDLFIYQTRSPYGLTV